MKTRIPTHINIAALTVTLLLAGCLSDGKTETASAAPDVGGTSNRAPTISGNPANAVKIGDTYSFTPTASDPDGDSLTFSVTNRPSWADFDTATGTLSGEPTLADVGQYANVRISVSDGTATANLNAFAVDVTQTATGSATLSWSAPTPRPTPGLAVMRLSFPRDADRQVRHGRARSWCSTLATAPSTIALPPGARPGS